MNATATVASVDGSVTGAPVSVDAVACGSGSGLDMAKEPIRRQMSGVTETGVAMQKEQDDAMETAAVVTTTTLALQKVKLEPGLSSPAHMTTTHVQPVSSSSSVAMTTPLRPLPVHQVASRHFPTASQRQQVALLSCMLQHFAAAVPKTLMQMQESYGIATEESASWSGQHPLQHTPISSEVA